MVRIGELLIQKGLTTEEAVSKALQRQAKMPGWKELRLGSILVVTGGIIGQAPRELTNAVLAEQGKGARIDDSEQATNLHVSIMYQW